MKNYPLLILFISSILLLSCDIFAQINSTDEQSVESNVEQTTQSILLLGDSISAAYGMKPTQGWVHLLNKKLTQQKQPYTIINASVSGETTSGGLSRLANLLANEKFDHLIIELGGNDGLRGYSPKLIKNNLLQMIALAKDKNIPVSLIKIKITPNYGPRYNKMFEQVFDDVARESKIILHPFFMEEIAVDSTLMQADGIHPNQEAQPIIASFVGEQLVELMAQ